MSDVLVEENWERSQHFFQDEQKNEKKRVVVLKRCFKLFKKEERDANVGKYTNKVSFNDSQSCKGVNGQYFL